MPSVPSRVFAFAPNWGLPDSVVVTAARGVGLDGITTLRFSGAGLSAVLLGAPRPDRLDLEISIAADAPAGPRILLLGPETVSEAFFYVTARFGYGGASGIGSHLL